MDPIVRDILEAVIMTAVSLVLGYLVTMVRSYLNKRMTAEELAIAKDFAARFVLAAEQSGLTGYIARDGQAKKEWAVGRIEEELKERNINLPVRVIADMVEAAVFEYLTSQKPAPPPEPEDTPGVG